MEVSHALIVRVNLVTIADICSAMEGVRAYSDLLTLTIAQNLILQVFMLLLHVLL